jgi:hypothetical protein
VSEYIIVDGQLYHHGIKGQKWGVRRFQNKDGSYTPAGKRRYFTDNGFKKASSEKYKRLRPDDTRKKTTHRERLERDFRNRGLSEAEAKAAADKRIKIEKTLAITAGVTVAACATYYARNKYIADHCDQILKAGTTFHNLDSTANPRPGEHLYVNYRQNDRDFFRGHFAVNKMRKTGQVFNHTITANEDIKIPSLDTRKSVFKQLYDKDPDFRKVFDEHSGKKDAFNTLGKISDDLGENNKLAKGLNKFRSEMAYENMWPKFGDKDNPEFNEAKHKYFEALKQKGYGAIVDEWDTNRFVFRSDAPLILLDTSHKSLGEMTIKELTSQDILLAQANSREFKLKTKVAEAVGMPHTNHFKESEKQLSRYATKSARNEANLKRYLDKVKSDEIEKVRKQFGDRDVVEMFKLDGSGDTHSVSKVDALTKAVDDANNTIKNLVRRERGELAVKAGKYLEKNEDMTAAQAMAKAAKHKKIVDNVVSSASSVSFFGTVAGVEYAMAKSQINNYRDEHPNTKLTDVEILKILSKQR